MNGRFLAAMALSILCAGCAGLDFGPRPKAAHQQVDMTSYFAARLESGRRHLDDGNLTRAIEAFRQASYDPATAADALNGMGVAYSMLGRDDVARGLFLRAIDRDPADPRFWRNLARLDEKAMLARRPEPAAPIPVEAAPEPAPAIAAAAARAGAEDGTALKPVRKREVFIRTIAAADSPPTTVPERAALAGTKRIEVLGSRKASPLTYPIRVELRPTGRAGITASGPVNGQTYPIRVAVRGR